jgi:hypothetical protein
VTGNLLTDIQITGRIIGQNSPLDHTAEEVRASLLERVMSFFLLIFILNTLPGFLGGGYLIHKNYGINSLFNNASDIPLYLALPFSAGLMATFM